MTETTQHEKKVVVDRTQWWRGRDESALLRKDGGKCCLGFMCLQHGATEDQCRNQAYPSGVNQHKPFEALDADAASVLLDNDRNSDFVFRAARINDDLGMKPSDPAREERLTELFKEHGWTIEFVN